jgi:hypothetical protein
LPTLEMVSSNRARYDPQVAVDTNEKQVSSVAKPSWAQTAR